MNRRRLSLALLLTFTWLFADATAAAADPPGPTDYQSEVTEIDPAMDTIKVEIVGGDSFVVLTATPGVSVDVVGYSGEPYLRFLADGTVEENQASPSKYVNEDRFGIADVPEDVARDASPEWVVVAEDGSFAWHDHRTHWMNQAKPPGKGPGDQVAEGVIPLFVDGVEVDVTVSSVWQEPPSALPVALGVTVGILLGFAMIRRRGNLVKTVLAGAAAAASAAGTIAYFSVPAETGPPFTMWVVPGTALVLVLLAAYRSSLAARSRRILLLVAALELVAWGVVHWDWLWTALLPTNLPFWLDRFIGASVLVTGIGAAVAVLLESATPQRPVSFRPR